MKSYPATWAEQTKLQRRAQCSRTASWGRAVGVGLFGIYGSLCSSVDETQFLAVDLEHAGNPPYVVVPQVSQPEHQQRTELPSASIPQPLSTAFVHYTVHNSAVYRTSRCLVCSHLIAIYAPAQYRLNSHPSTVIGSNSPTYCTSSGTFAMSSEGADAHPIPAVSIHQSDRPAASHANQAWRQCGGHAVCTQSAGMPNPCPCHAFIATSGPPVFFAG